MANGGSLVRSCRTNTHRSRIDLADAVPPLAAFEEAGHALGANASLRCLSGFLIFYLAFLLREHPMAGQSAAVSLGIEAFRAGNLEVRPLQSYFATAA